MPAATVLDRGAGDNCFARAEVLMMNARVFALHDGRTLVEHPLAPFVLWSIDETRELAETTVFVQVVRWLRAGRVAR